MTATESAPMLSPSKLTQLTCNSSGDEYSHSPCKTKYQSPTKSRRVQKWSPSSRWGGGRSTPGRGHKIISHGSSYFSRSHRKGTDPTKNWDVNSLKLDLDTDIFVERIARMLEEMNVFLIRKIVLCLGKETAIDLMKTTQAVQHLGGLDLPTTPTIGSHARSKRKKRTIGGVFIQLAKEKIPIDQWKGINQASEKNKPKKGKRRGATPRSSMSTPRSSACSTPRHSTDTKILFGSGPGPAEDKDAHGGRNLNKAFQSISLNQTLPEKNQQIPIECAHPNKQMRDKQQIGETLFPQIQAQEPRYARKITGMLLEGMDNLQLSKLMAEPNLLKETVNEALRQYKEAVEPEKQRQRVGEQIYNKVKSSVTAQEQPFISKITGMLLEQNDALLLQRILEQPDALSFCINIAMKELQQVKQRLGEKLYPKVLLHTTNAKKVTGMLLEFDVVDVETLLKDAFKLKEKVEECLSILGANDLVINFVTPFSKKKSRKCLLR